MNAKKLLLHWLSFLLLIHFSQTYCWAQNTPDVQVSGHFEQQPLTEILTRIEQEANIKFYYLPQWISHIKVDGDFQEVPLSTFLWEVLTDNDLSFIAYHPHAMVLVKTPDARFTHVADTFSRDQDNLAERIVIGNAKNTVNGQMTTLSGIVQDAGTGDAISGANVTVEGEDVGVSTNSRGYYTLSLPSGGYFIRFEHVGLEAERKYFQLYESGTYDIGLYPAPIQMDPVEVRGEAESLFDPQMGKTSLSMQTIERMPAFLGEVDITNSLTSLPGVSTVGEGTTGFNVRGGDVGQNLVLLDEALVFNTSHLLGFFTTFSADAVEEIEFYRGGVPAHYGGRVSSVLKVQQKSGNTEKLTGNGGIGLATARLTLEGPIVKDKTTFMLSGRSSYSDWMLNLMPDANLRNSQAFFYDGSAKITHRFSEKTKLSISSYLSNDKFRFAGDTLYRWGTFSSSARFEHSLNERLVGHLGVGYSDYGYTVEDPNPTNAYQLDFGIQATTFRAGFSFFPENHQLDFGLEGVWYQFEPGHIRPASDQSVINPLKLEDEQSLELALYVNDEWQLSDRTSLMLGVRYSTFQNFGPGTVYQYQEGVPRSENTIVDTLQYGNGEVIERYGGIEPRVALRYAITSQSTIKLSYHRMRQYVHLISNTAAITPTDSWKSSDTYLKPQMADQWSVGYFRSFSGKQIEASVEAYYKNMDNVTDYKEGTTLLLNETLEADLLQGKGRAYGVEFLLQKKAGNLTGWASYNYSRSERQIQGAYPEETINEGAYYPAYFDKPHNLNLFTNYTLRRWSFSANFNYSTGRPVTAPDSKYFVNDVLIADYSGRNQYRIPDYHRLDISVTLDGNRKKNKKIHGSYTLSLYNVYARKNAYSVFFDNRGEGVARAYQLSVLGTIFPSFTWNFKF